MVKLPSFLRFGAKTARRYTSDSLQKDTDKANPDNALTLKLKDYVSTDPDLAAGMRKFVDNLLIEMPLIIKTAKSKVADSTVDTYNQELRDVRFYRRMRNAAYSLLYNGNAFFEIRFTGKKLKELYNIDPDTMKIETNSAGEPIKYVQEIAGKKVEFMPEEIVHLTIDHLETGEWGLAFLKPLSDALFRKQVAESYLAWLIENNKFSPLIAAKTSESMTIDELGRIRAEIEATSSDPNRYHFLNFEHTDTLEVIKLFTTEDFADINSYIDIQRSAILTVLQVPPIISGTVDNSNRSNSEIQARFVFLNTIKAFQNLVVEELNYEMLRKLNWKDVQFKFSETDARNETDVVKIAKSLKQDLNFTDEAVLEYLRKNGFKIPEVDKVFEDIVVEAEVSNGGDFPSREPRDKTGIPGNEAMRKEDKQMGVSSNEN